MNAQHLPYLVPEVLQFAHVLRVEPMFWDWLDEQSVLKLALSKHDTPLNVWVLGDDGL